MKWFRAIGLILVLLVAIVGIQAQEPSGTLDEICAAAEIETPETRTYDEADMVLESDVNYQAVFCTDEGAVYIDLLEDYAPLTVNNFVFLAQNGYYNNTVFHRVIEDFMAQGGDPTATGTGGPGYQFEDEFVGFLNFAEPGWLAMANAGPGTNGSQFFITTAPTPHLDFRHTIFGKVLEGQDVVLALNIGDPQVPDFTPSALDTVVIITDPSTVTSDYEAPESLGQEELETGFEALVSELPEGLEVLEDSSGTFTTDEVIAAVPEDLQGDFEAFAEANNHEFRAGRIFTNATCSDQYFFTELGYTVDAFASEADATAALASDVLSELAASLGYADVTEAESINDLTVYTGETETCSGNPGAQGIAFLQRGRYIVSVNVLVDAAILDQADMGNILTQGAAPIFERAISDVLVAEIQ